LDSNIEGLKNEYEFELEIRSSQIRTSFNNPGIAEVKVVFCRMHDF